MDGGSIPPSSTTSPLFSRGVGRLVITSDHVWVCSLGKRERTNSGDGHPTDATSASDDTPAAAYAHASRRR